MLSGLMWELQLSLEHAAEHAVGSVFMKATDFVNQTRTALCDMIHFSGCSAPLGSSPSQGAYELQVGAPAHKSHSLMLCLLLLHIAHRQCVVWPSD